MASAIRRFEIEEGSTANLWYEIKVKFRGKVIKRFYAPTMQQAVTEFENAGYERVAWCEGGRVVLQDK